MTDLDGDLDGTRDGGSPRSAQDIAGDYHPSRPEHHGTDAAHLSAAADALRAGPPADDHAVRTACVRLLDEVARCRRAGDHVAPAVSGAVGAIAVGVLTPASAPARPAGVAPPARALRHCLDRRDGAAARG